MSKAVLEYYAGLTNSMIAKFKAKNSREPQAVIIHPGIYAKIRASFNHLPQNSMEIFGALKVYRTMDLEEGEIVLM